VKNKVLIIEDEAHIVELIAYNLEAGGYAVSKAFDGKEGLELINQVKPDLIILDIMMPKIDGIGVLNRLRNDKTISHIPVIMLTAKSSEIDKVIGLEVGADDYMTKPFSINELMARVKAHLRRSERERDMSNDATRQMTYGDVVIDLEKYEVHKSGELVALSLKEFELLRMLLKNRGRVMTRDQLLDQVWGYDYFGETRTVDVHIRHLRSKLDNDDDSLIHTVRGIGYTIK
jgi:two-component system alkaline phosphatase synthesis response regulator PhoP